MDFAIYALQVISMIIVIIVVGCVYEYVTLLAAEITRLYKHALRIKWILLGVQAILILILTTGAVYICESPTTDDYTLHEAECRHVDWYSPWDQNVTVIWKLNGFDQESPGCTFNDTLPPFTIFEEGYLRPRECCYRTYPIRQDNWALPQPPRRMVSCESLHLGKCPPGPWHLITSCLVVTLLIWADLIVLVAFFMTYNRIHFRITNTLTRTHTS